MAKSLLEYMDWLEQRDLIWPRPPVPRPMKATPFVKELPGIKAVTWEVYGCLLTIHEGRLLHRPDQELRLQIALEKTIEEFHMWQSMTRKPGAPWEYMLRTYDKVLSDRQMTGTKRRGDLTQVDSGEVWRRIIERLIKNEYTWDVGEYGDLDELADKVAFFFHANLQGVCCAPEAAGTLQRIHEWGIAQGLLAETQVFTLAQLLKALMREGKLGQVGELFSSNLLVQSHQYGLRKPSPTLFEQAAKQVRSLGWEPQEVLHVTHRLADDLVPAHEQGFRTALYAGDANCCRITTQQFQESPVKPDRIITQLSQVLQILGIDASPGTSSAEDA